MNFFSAQADARRNTVLLACFLVLAIVGIVFILYFPLHVAIFLFFSAKKTSFNQFQWWDTESFLWIAFIITSVIVGAAVYKSMQLARDGGASIALNLGGRQVNRSTEDSLERKLLNVTEEMAIASGIPVPRVFVMDREMFINAFAAGNRINNAVIAVTRGALNHLDRDELQGVIAHEFSHILNGDVQLNIRMIGLLHGLTMITISGRECVTTHHHPGLILLGMVLVIIGWIGQVFCNLCKAAVSRQREFLADAASVQFTRNASGLARALSKIATIGSVIHHPASISVSHMCLGSSGTAAGWLDTHPPIHERIRRVDPLQYLRFSRKTAKTAVTRSSALAPVRDIPDIQALTSSPGMSLQHFQPDGIHHAMNANATPELLPWVHDLLESLPKPVFKALHDRLASRLVILAMVLSRDEKVRMNQLILIQDEYDIVVRSDTRSYAQWYENASPALRLPVLDCALASLMELPSEAIKKLLDTVDLIIAQEPRKLFSHYVLRSLLQDSLLPLSREKFNEKKVSEDILKADIASLLAFLAFTAGQAGEVRKKSYQTAVTRLTTGSGLTDWPRFDEAVMPTLERFDHIFSHLQGTHQSFRQTVMDACVQAVDADGRITSAEAEMMRVICKKLDCPVPVILRYPSRLKET